MEANAGFLKTGSNFPRRVGRGSVAMVLVTALLVGGTYLWQHAELDARQAALSDAVSSGVAAGDRATALADQVAALQGRIETLTQDGDGLRARLEQAVHDAKHVAARLRTTEHSLGTAEARMTALLGSPIADGRYFGQVIVVGANQSPPRLVIDLETWLTGDAAHEAAIEYGVPPEDAFYDNFIENESPAWHTVVIAPTATVSIIDMDSPDPLLEVGTGLVGTERISLGRFATMMRLQRLYNPFWITVSDGRITSIEEEYTS
jgi:hypothetical protein